MAPDPRRAGAQGRPHGRGAIAFSLRYLGPFWSAILRRRRARLQPLPAPPHRRPQALARARAGLRRLDRHHPLSARRAAADPGLLPAAGGGGGGLGHPRLRRRHGLGRRHVARPAQAPLEPAEELDGIARLRALRHPGRGRAAGLDGAGTGARYALGVRRWRPASPPPCSPPRSNRCRRGWTTTSACRSSPGSSCSASCSPRGAGTPSWPSPACRCGSRSPPPSTRRSPGSPTRRAR